MEPPAASLFEKRLGEKLYAGSYLRTDGSFSLPRLRAGERSLFGDIISAKLVMIAIGDHLERPALKLQIIAYSAGLLAPRIALTRGLICGQTPSSACLDSKHREICRAGACSRRFGSRLRQPAPAKLRTSGAFSPDGEKNHFLLLHFRTICATIFHANRITLIKSGGGTGPMKPRQPIRSGQGANSSR